MLWLSTFWRMKIRRFLAAVLITMWALAGCAGPLESLVPGQVIRGTGRIEQIDYDLARFDRIRVGAIFQTTVEQGNAFRVLVEADSALVPYLNVRVDGDTLYLELEPNIRTTGMVTLRAQVIMPALRSLRASGASGVQVTGFAGDEDLELEVSGASRLTGNLDSGATRITLSGASRVEVTGDRHDVALNVSGSSRALLQGSGGDVAVRASGASHVDLSGFSAQDADLRASGASSIVAQVSGRLEAEASGSSSIRYIGEPASIVQRATGASSIRKE